MACAPEQAPTVTVAVLNHRRPDLLPRALAGIAQLDYPCFEIVVVGDQPDLAAYALPGWLAAQVRYVAFAEPNICRARNHAVRISRGEVIAFLDDDAVPEPTWLTELTQPFAAAAVATVGGLVRASDGISIEWQGGTFTRSGDETPLELSDDITLQSADAQHASGRYLSLRGVNSAFRRTALMQAGGFDEAIRYYLDETDMALRLADSGWSAAIARRAEVHHLLVPNATRGLLRKPGNQHEIGAAKAHFCRKHAPVGANQALTAFRRRRVAMLDPQMRLGIVRVQDRDRVDRELAAGMAEGLTRETFQPLVPDSPEALVPFRPAANPQHATRIAIETGWHPGTNAALLALGKRLAGAGHIVTCLTFRSGFHGAKVSYRDGIWHHTGGTWTLPHGSGNTMAITRAARARAECARIAAARPIDVILKACAATDTGPTIELPGSRHRVAIHATDTSATMIHAALVLLQSVAELPEPAQSVAEESIHRQPAAGLTAMVP